VDWKWENGINHSLIVFYRGELKQIISQTAKEKRSSDTVRLEIYGWERTLKLGIINPLPQGSSSGLK
jgi:hypothetical protein